MSQLSLGRIGIWSGEVRYGDAGAGRDAAAAVESLGFGALWMPGGIDDRVLDDLSGLLDATRTMPLCTGILNIWKLSPADVGAWWAGRSDADRARLMLGLGVSHGPAIGAAYGRPIETMAAYLDRLDAAGVPADRRCLAALGPKMLDLAAARTAGAHPYLVPPEHIALARARMGPDALIATEVGVVLESDPARARAIARAGIALYLQFPNYANNWRRLGFGEEDIATASDRLIDALFAWGSIERIAARIGEYLAAGADHVCVQVVRGAYGDHPAPPLDAWRRLAEALL